MKTKIKFSYFSYVINKYSICPIVFNVYEALKVNYGQITACITMKMMIYCITKIEPTNTMHWIRMGGALDP